MSHILNVKLPDSTETPQIGRALGVPSPQYPVCTERVALLH